MVKKKKTQSSKRRLIFTLIAFALTVLVWCTLFMTFKKSVTGSLVVNLYTGWGLIEGVLNGDITQTPYIIMTIGYILTLLTTLLVTIMMVLITLGRKKYLLVTKLIGIMLAIFALVTLIIALVTIGEERVLNVSYNKLTWAGYISTLTALSVSVVSFMNR